jgi:hypothetical protein
MVVEKFDSYRDGGTAEVTANVNGAVVRYFIHGTCKAHDRKDVTKSYESDSTPSVATCIAGTEEVKELLEAILRTGPINHDPGIYNAYAYHYGIVRALIINLGVVDVEKFG